MNKIEKATLQRHLDIQEGLQYSNPGTDSVVLTAKAFLVGLKSTSPGALEQDAFIQLHRSVFSAASNWVEGQAKGGDQIINFLRIARGSIVEAQAQLEMLDLVDIGGHLTTICDLIDNELGSRVEQAIKELVQMD